MNHHVYEDWLFADLEASDSGLTPEQAIALQEHLQSCQSCRDQAASWREMELVLRKMPITSPQSGFALRWQSRFEKQRQQLYRRQSFAVFGFLLGGALILFASLLLLAWPWLGRPEIIVWSWVYRLAALVAVVEPVGDLFAVVLGSVTGNISPIWWILFVGLLSEMVVLWLVSFRVLTNPRRVLQ